MDQALESQWIAGAGQLGAEFFNGIDPERPFVPVTFTGRLGTEAT
jgi:hypothetical protein